MQKKLKAIKQKEFRFEKSCNFPRILEMLQKFKLAKNQSGIIWAQFSILLAEG